MPIRAGISSRIHTYVCVCMDVCDTICINVNNAYATYVACRQANRQGLDLILHTHTHTCIHMYIRTYVCISTYK